jgi:hypothetical protein
MPKQKEIKQKRTRNKWTQWFVQMLTAQTKGYDLEIIYDYELYKEPMRIDVVVVKKPENVVIKNSAMKFFKNHNVIEFKGPVDRLTIQSYDRVMSYFYSYLSQNSLSFSDIAITFVSVKKPENMLEILQKERKYKIIPQKEAGIYYILSEGIPATQLIVSNEAKSGDLTWVRALRDDLTLEEGLEVIEKFGNEDVVQSLLLANKNLLEEIDNMLVKDAKLRRIMEKASGKTFAEEMQKGVQQGMQKMKSELFALWEQGIPITEAKKRLGY